MRSALVLAVLCALNATVAKPPVAPVAAPPVPESTWPMYQYRASHNAVFSLQGFRNAWVAQLGGRVNGGLALVGNTLYADSFDKRLYAIDVQTGSVRWSAKAPNILMSSPVIADNRVIAGSGHNGFLPTDDTAEMWGRAAGDDVLAVDARTGRLLWSYHTVGEDMASPAIGAGRVVFANGDLHAYALRIDDGHMLWRTPLAGVATMSSATIVDGRMFVGVCHNVPHFRATYALDVASGRVIWRNPNGSCDSSPTVEHGIVFVDGNDESRDGRYQPGGSDIVAAIDSSNGRTLWRHVSDEAPYTIVASGEHAIAGTAADGVLYQSQVNRDRVTAFDGRSGRVLWSARTMAPVKMSPVVTRDRVFFGDTTGLLYSVDRGTGKILRTDAFQSPFSTSPPLVVGDTLIVANGDAIFAVPLSVI